MTHSVQDTALPPGWSHYRFTDVLIDGAISYGIVQPGAHTERNSVPVLRVNNVRNGQIDTRDVLRVAADVEAQYVRTRLVGGELLVTVVGTVGECAIVPVTLKGWNVARAISVARIKPEFDTRFIKYCFKLDDVVFQMYGNTNDTVQPTLNLGQLKNLVFSIPSPDEQRAISDVLGSLDNKIDLLRRQNQCLEAMAEALFRQWFEGDEAASWPEGVVEDLLVLQRGYDLPLQDRREGPYPIISSSGVSGWHDEHKVAAPGVSTGRSGLIGNVFLVQEDFWPLNTSLYVKEFKLATPLFAYFTLKTLDLPAFNAGSAVPTLNRNHVHAQATLLPPRDLIERFEATCWPMFKKIKHNEDQAAQLTSLRDTLLPKLMSGEVRVAC
ncbi:MAG: restriction endonuclease subunit S [Burkholderiales bacterium]|nr:restriction endonuclease subunit S [Burkholderiales bacterium]